MAWIIYGREIYIVFSFLLTLGAILYFSKADVALLFRGFSFAFCGKRIFLGMAFLLSFILFSWIVFLLAQVPIENPFVILNQFFALTLYQGNQLLFGSESFLYQTNNYNLYVQNSSLFLQQIQNLKLWDILALILLLLVLNAYYGGAISRSVAVEIATGNIPSLKETRLFTQKRFSHYLFPIFLVLGGILFLFGTNALMGFLSSFTNAVLHYIGLDFREIGYSLLALAFPLLLILSFIITLLLSGGIFAFFFFPVSVSVEGGDFFDSFSRSFSYFFARPWHFFFYQMIAMLYGAMVLIFSAFFLLVMLLLSFKACNLGFNFWNEHSFQKVFLDSLGNPDWSPHQIIFTTILFLFQIAFLGFVLAYFYFAQTSIYLLIRKSYDLVDIQHIYFAEEQLHEFDVLQAGFVQSNPNPPSSSEPSSSENSFSSSTQTETIPDRPILSNLSSENTSNAIKVEENSSPPDSVKETENSPPPDPIKETQPLSTNSSLSTVESNKPKPTHSTETSGAEKIASDQKKSASPGLTPAPAVKSYPKKPITKKKKKK